jgi:hypothetical protein
MDFFVHTANVLYLASYSVRDILWLRLLTVVAGATLMPFYYLQPEPLMVPIYWNCLFLAVNGYQIYRLLLERRPVQLTEPEQRLYKMAFRTLTPREFVKLLQLATWEKATAGETIILAGQNLDALSVLCDGTAAVNVSGETITELQAGRFMGEMSYLTGDMPSAAVVAKTDASYVSWKQEALRKFLDDKLDLRAALQNIIGTDLVDKLRAQER